MKKFLFLLVTLVLSSSIIFPQKTRIGGRVNGGGEVNVGISSAIVFFVNDTFTGTDGTTLVSHTGEAGATWTLHSSFTDTISIQTNRAGKDSGTVSTVYYASGTSASLNYTIEGVIVDIGDVSRATGVCGWISTGADTMLCVRRQNQTTWQFLKIIAGTATGVTMTTGSNTSATSFSLGVSNTLKLVRTTGDNFEWFLNNVSQGTATVSDSEFQTAGRVGIRSSNIHTATGFHVDRISAW